jgi:hypothetical protein
VYPGVSYTLTLTQRHSGEIKKYQHPHNKHTKCALLLYTIVMIISLLSMVTYLSIGTKIYQEYRVKALAKYFGAKLLTIDSSMLFGVKP